MANEQRYMPDDLLDRAIAARKDMAIPLGPPLPVLAATRERLNATDFTRTVSLIRRILTMKALSKLAVAAILAVAITGIFFFMRGTSSVAFADVLQGVRTAQSVSFKGSGTITVPGN